MKPSKWVSPGGKVHWRRLRFWVGTRFEKVADDKHIVVLCGRWSGLNTQAPDDAEITCGVCRKAANTGAQHL